MTGLINLLYLSNWKVPISALSRIEKDIRSFLWSQGEANRKIHLIGWHLVTKSKEEGDLRILNLRDMQKALLCKFLFHLFDARNEAWSQWITLNYKWTQGTEVTHNLNNLSSLMKEIVKASLAFKGAIITSDDTYNWVLTRNLKFSTKSAMKLLKSSPLPNFHLSHFWPWKTIWKLKLIPKIKIFLWKLMNCSLPIKSCLTARGWKGDSLCDLCPSKIEDDNHVFFKYTYASSI